MIHRRERPCSFSRAHLPVDLRSQDDLVAPALERAPTIRFGLALAVHVGGVDEIDPPVKALWMMRTHSSSSVFPQGPNIIVPRQNALTFTRSTEQAIFHAGDLLTTGADSAVHRRYSGGADMRWWATMAIT
jgi:hypothetical protein